MKVDRLRLAPQAVEDTRFCGRVKAGSGLIQNQHPRLLQKRSREGEALTFSTRELATVRSDSLAKAARQRSNHSRAVPPSEWLLRVPVLERWAAQTANWRRLNHRIKPGRAGDNRRSGEGSSDEYFEYLRPPVALRHETGS